MDLHRRAFLFAAAGALALPWLEQFAGSPAARRRMVLICAPLGFHPDYLFPEKAGRDYVATPYLEELAELRQDLTVVSGLCHVGGSSSFGHQATASFLTGAPGAGR